MNNQFSENLKKIRKEHNLSQEDLAEKLGVSRQSVSKWESNQAYPEMDKMIQICKMFNLNIDELLNHDINESKDITIVLSSADDVQAVGGKIASADTSCVKINSISPANASTSAYGNMFAMASMGTIPANTEIVKVNVTGLKNCVTKLNFSDATVTSTSSVDVTASVAASNITVGNSSSTPKSSDASLKSLTLSKGTLEFSSNVTS